MTEELEIDLRPYIRVLFNYWYLIALAVLIAASVTYLYIASRPKYFEATALVAITEPDYLMEFDSRIETLSDGKPAYKMFPEFAMGKELISEVSTRLDPKPEVIVTYDDLAKRMTASSGEDPSLVHLTVRMPSPRDAALVANVWAEVFIEKAHMVFGNTRKDQVAFFEAQVADNKLEMEQAEQAMIAFESETQLDILRDELTIKQELHLKYLRQQQNSDFTIRDLEGLQNYLKTRNTAEPATFADQLSLLSLQTSTYSSGNAVPVNLQLPENTALTDQTVGDQLLIIDNLLNVLQEKNIEITAKTEELLPVITALQVQISELQMEKTQLNRNLSLKRDTDTLLTNKLEEVTLSSQEAPNEFRSAGKAMQPFRAAGPGKLMNTLVAGVTAGLMSISVLLFMEYWRSGVPETEKSKRNNSLRRLFGGDGAGREAKTPVKETVTNLESQT